MKTYYINLTFDDLTFPNQRSVPNLFRSLDFRYEYWWLRFVRDNGTGLTAISDGSPTPKNISFARYELATIIGGPVLDQKYGYYTERDKKHWLRAVVTVYQDSPTGDNSVKFDIFVNGVNSGKRININPAGSSSVERSQVNVISPIKLNIGDHLQIAPADVGTASPGQNYKVYGIFTK